MLLLWSLTSALAGNSVLGPPQFPVTLPVAPSTDAKPRGAILSGEVGRQAVLYSCLNAPRNQIVVWTPTSTDIEHLETALPRFMSKQHVPADYRPLHEYYRQYAGFTSHGKRFICVNFFHYSHVVDVLTLASRDSRLYGKLKASGPVEEFWRREVVFVNDGGAHYFNVEYDIELGAFAFLSFNGYA